MNVFVQHEVGSRTIQCKDDIVIAILPGRILFARVPGAMANEHALANIGEVTKHIKWAMGEERVAPSSTLHLYLLSPTDTQGNPGYSAVRASRANNTTDDPEHNMINSGDNTTIVGQRARARAEAVRHHLLKFAKQGVENATFYYRAFKNLIERPEEHAGKRYFVRVGPFGQKEESEAARPRPHVLVVDSAGKSVVRDAVTGPLASEHQEECAAVSLLET